MLLPAVHAKADAFMVMLTEELTEIKTSPPLGHVFFVSSTKSPSTRSLLVLAFERDEKILMRTKVCDLNSKELPPKSTKDTVTGGKEPPGDIEMFDGSGAARTALQTSPDEFTL